MLNQVIALLGAVSMLAASTPVAPSDAVAFQQLLQEQNAFHAQINAPATDFTQYQYHFNSGQPLFTETDGQLLRAPSNDMEFTNPLPVADARAEIEWMFRLLRLQYGLYEWSGGDTAFNAAQDAILAALPKTGSISLAAYEDLLITHLAFIRDCHFQIDGHNFSPEIQLFSNESQIFYRKNNMFYRDAACSKAITAIDNLAPAQTLHRAIDTQGSLTWGLYKMAQSADSYTVTIQYADRSTEKITLHPAISWDSCQASPEVYRYDVRHNIPFVTLNQTVFGSDDQSGWTNSHNEDDKQAVLASAAAIKPYPAAVIDLSHNPGGNGDLPLAWFQQYTGQAAQPNYNMMRIRPSEQWVRSAYGAQTAEEIQAVQQQRDAYCLEDGMRIDGNYYVSTSEPQFIRNDGPLLLVLTSHRTSSAAEIFTDVLHNLSNVLTIGANTGGVLTNAANYGLQLPYSGLFFQFGECLFDWNPDYFSEGIGMAPDIYLTGEHLEERFAKFLQRYISETLE